MEHGGGRETGEGGRRKEEVQNCALAWTGSTFWPKVVLSPTREAHFGQKCETLFNFGGWAGET